MATEPADGPGSVTAAVTREMVRIYKEHFGRGPTVARTAWCGNDVITCVLENTFTPVEESLVRLGEHQRLRDMRMVFQYASMREFCEPVERLTGRKVRSFVSGIDTMVAGLSIETFILHPEGSDEASRTEMGDGVVASAN
ncbi:MAG: hypothetical protein QOF76_2944 [Solirubrobacteraceae bacterium]|nr:hypothetical protein [Solirubrobacteraceae bacterium]